MKFKGKEELGFVAFENKEKRNIQNEEKKRRRR
jgi:hypothetical protein